MSRLLDLHSLSSQPYGTTWMMSPTSTACPIAHSIPLTWRKSGRASHTYWVSEGEAWERLSDECSGEPIRPWWLVPLPPPHGGEPSPQETACWELRKAEQGGPSPTSQKTQKLSPKQISKMQKTQLSTRPRQPSPERRRSHEVTIKRR